MSLSHAADARFIAGLLEEHGYQLALGDQRLVIGHMPGLPVGFLMFPQQHQRPAEILNKGVGVGNIQPAKQLGCFTLQDRMDGSVHQAVESSTPGPKKSEPRPITTGSLPAWWAVRAASAIWRPGASFAGGGGVRQFLRGSGR